MILCILNLFWNFFFNSFLSSSFITFLFDHFSFHLFVHHLVLLFPFSFLSFLHSSFISLSPCFSFFLSLYLMFPYLFLHRSFCVFSFCFNSCFFFSLFCSWSHSFFLVSLPVFLHLCIWFLLPKRFICSWIYVCLFGTLPLSVVLLFFPPCVVLLPCAFHVFFWFVAFFVWNLLFLIFFYQSSFLGLFKNCRLVFFFWKITKLSISFFQEKNSLFFFFLWSVFLVSLMLFARCDMLRSSTRSRGLKPLLTRATEYVVLCWHILRSPWSEPAALKASPPWRSTITWLSRTSRERRILLRLICDLFGAVLPNVVGHRVLAFHKRSLGLALETRVYFCVVPVVYCTTTHSICVLPVNVLGEHFSALSRQMFKRGLWNKRHCYWRSLNFAWLENFFHSLSHTQCWFARHVGPRSSSTCSFSTENCRSTTRSPVCSFCWICSCPTLTVRPCGLLSCYPVLVALLVSAGLIMWALCCCWGERFQCLHPFRKLLSWASLENKVDGKALYQFLLRRNVHLWHSFSTSFAWTSESRFQSQVLPFIVAVDCECSPTKMPVVYPTRWAFRIPASWKLPAHSLHFVNHSVLT